MKGTLQEIVHQQGLKHHIGELCPTCEYFEKVGHVPFPFSDVIPIFTHLKLFKKGFDLRSKFKIIL